MNNAERFRCKELNKDDYTVAIVDDVPNEVSRITELISRKMGKRGCVFPVGNIKELEELAFGDVKRQIMPVQAIIIDGAISPRDPKWNFLNTTLSLHPTSATTRVEKIIAHLRDPNGINYGGIIAVMTGIQPSSDLELEELNKLFGKYKKSGANLSFLKSRLMDDVFLKNFVNRLLDGSYS